LGTSGHWEIYFNNLISKFRLFFRKNKIMTELKKFREGRVTIASICKSEIFRDQIAKIASLPDTGNLGGRFLFVEKGDQNVWC